MSTLEYATGQIAAVCGYARQRCEPYFETLRQQWRASPWPLEKLAYYCQVPELHLSIEAFFSGLKSLLDLEVQLLSTEGIVGITLAGFHRDKGRYGGVVLNALEHNARSERKATAAAVAQLVRYHKATWIDAVIQARDLLVHPGRGQQQLMLQLHLAVTDGELEMKGVLPPHVRDEPIDAYAKARISNARDFSTALLAQLLVA